jgi:hypothetical protein
MKRNLAGPHPARATYRIEVSGALDERWLNWFSQVSAASHDDAGDGPTTMLTVTDADQSTLRGILNRIWDLNLSLISVRRIEMGTGDRCDDGNEMGTRPPHA